MTNVRISGTPRTSVEKALHWIDFKKIFSDPMNMGKEEKFESVLRTTTSLVGRELTDFELCYVEDVFNRELYAYDHHIVYEAAGIVFL